jgi:hypothetical protein
MNMIEPMAGGRYLGFPKFIVDEATLEFHSRITRQLELWEKELAGNESFFSNGGEFSGTYNHL